MLKISAIIIAVVCAHGISANTTPPSDSEAEQLRRDELEQITKSNLDLLASRSANNQPARNATQSTQRRCKVFPGDSDWPSSLDWDALNRATDGALLKPSPASSVCYQNSANYNETSCAAVTARWEELRWHTEDPLEMISPPYEGNTCLPPSVYDSGNCTQGGYPGYVLNVSTIADIQKAVMFARNTGVRLVIRNTGHDYNGKSGGAGSLSIWMHHFKQLEFIEQYKDSVIGYSGPAFKASAGIQVFEIYQAARDRGLMVVGGECSTVGFAGGYIQGGGHSALTSFLGMAADQVLEFELVLANGSFISASRTENDDLFWALRGGGGGTFGIVTSVTVKAHPDVPVAITRLSFSLANGSTPETTFWSGVESFFSFFPAWADAGLYTHFFLWPETTDVSTTSLNLDPFLAPNKTIKELKQEISPWLDKLSSLGIAVEPEYIQYSNFYSAWNATYLENMGAPNLVAASRLWPRSNWDNETSFNATFQAIKSSVLAGYRPFGYGMGPPVLGDGSQDNAVSPAWRNTVSHMITALSWRADSTPEEILEQWDAFEQSMDRWREVSPGGGSYLNEADRLEPNWQQSLYGDHYQRLLQIKKQYDPEDVFYAHHAVGSEGWRVESVDGLPNENGRLCRVNASDD